ncbi:DUF3630 family protein [Pseudoalteromonas fenneropenaei]|uniref:DUF3630 family protein n=1 Tax=Pseudoalteromonas fenneropenaei TaxID=1737459 RepID=A0ABV7CLG2_9GAMM
MPICQLDAQHQILLLSPEIFPHSDEFALWARIFLHHPEIQIVEINLGADRHQARFHFAEEGFNLNFEHYSESLWISPEGQQAAAKLPDLQNIF